MSFSIFQSDFAYFHLICSFFVLIFQSGALKRVIPLLDRILVQRIEAVTQTKGGIVIPETAQSKVNQATVVAVGPGGRDKVNGRLRCVT